MGEKRERPPVWRVRSAESPNAGAHIPGAAEDCHRLAMAALERVRTATTGDRP